MGHPHLPAKKFCLTNGNDQVCWDFHSNVVRRGSIPVRELQNSSDNAFVPNQLYSQVRGRSISVALQRLETGLPENVTGYEKVPGVRVNVQRNVSGFDPTLQHIYESAKNAAAQHPQDVRKALTKYCEPLELDEKKQGCAVLIQSAYLDDDYPPVFIIGRQSKNEKLYFAVGSDLYVSENDETLLAIIDQGHMLNQRWYRFGAIEPYELPDNDPHIKTEWDSISPEDQAKILRRSGATIAGIRAYLNNGAHLSLKDYVLSNHLEFRFDPEMFYAYAYQRANVIGLGHATVDYDHSDSPIAKEVTARTAVHEIGHHKYGRTHSSVVAAFAYNINPYPLDVHDKKIYFQRYEYLETETFARLSEAGLAYGTFNAAMANADTDRVNVARDQMEEDLDALDSYAAGVKTLLPPAVAVSSFTRIQREVENTPWIDSEVKPLLVNTVERYKADVSPVIGPIGESYRDWFDSVSFKTSVYPVTIFGTKWDLGYMATGAWVGSTVSTLCSLAGVFLPRVSSPFFRAVAGGVACVAYNHYTGQKLNVWQSFLTGVAGGVAARASSLLFSRPTGMTPLGSIVKNNFWKEFLFNSPRITNRVRSVYQLAFGAGGPATDRLVPRTFWLHRAVGWLGTKKDSLFGLGKDAILAEAATFGISIYCDGWSKSFNLRTLDNFSFGNSLSKAISS